MTFATLQDAQRECNNHAGEFPGWYAAVFEQAADHRFFFMWAATTMELLKAQTRHNAYIVSMLVHGERANGFIQWPGEWERRDHFYRYLYAIHLLADETEGLSPANKALADGIALLMRHNHFDEAFRDGAFARLNDISAHVEELARQIPPKAKYRRTPQEIQAQREHAAMVDAAYAAWQAAHAATAQEKTA